MDFEIVLLIVGGLALLVAGGDLFVRGAVAVALRLRVSKLVIGVTLVGFGTSLPELVTSLRAALADAPGIAVGNVVGSNIANTLLILGVAAVLAPPRLVSKGMVRDASVGLGAVALLAVLLLSGFMNQIWGLAFLAGLGIYLWTVVRQSSRDRALTDAAVKTEPKGDAVAKGESQESETAAPPPAPAAGRPLWMLLVLAFVGLVLVVSGADFLVRGCVALAQNFGVREAVIGLTIVAVGTSLPELTVTLAAALKKESDVSVGNVLGSNIFNALGILGATASMSDISGSDAVRLPTLAILVISALALYWAVKWRHRITRGEGAVALLAYGLFIAYLAATATR